MVSGAVLWPVLRSPEGSGLKPAGMLLAGSSAVANCAPSSEAGALADGDALAEGDDAESAVAEDEDDALEQPAIRTPRTAAGTLRRAR